MGVNTGSKVTIRRDLIEAGGSHDVWYGGDGPCREATPCFGTPPHCLQVQLARHCLLANEPSASVAPSEVWRRWSLSRSDTLFRHTTSLPAGTTGAPLPV